MLHFLYILFSASSSHANVNLGDKDGLQIFKDTYKLEQPGEYEGIKICVGYVNRINYNNRGLKLLRFKENLDCLIFVYMKKFKGAKGFSWERIDEKSKTRLSYRNSLERGLVYEIPKSVSKKFCMEICKKFALSHNPRDITEYKKTAIIMAGTEVEKLVKLLEKYQMKKEKKRNKKVNPEEDREE